MVGLVNLEGFGQSNEAFHRRARLIEALVGVGLPVGWPARQVAGFAMHLADGGTDGTDNALNPVGVFTRPGAGRISCPVHGPSGSAW